MFYIYKHTHRDSGRAYIGKTNDMKRRINNHISDSRNGSELAFHRAIQKYGIDKFDTEILWEGECESVAYEIEVKLIAEHDTYINGYNMDSGGLGATIGNTNRVGCTHSNETKKHLSKVRKNVPKCKNHRNSISKSLKGKSKNYENGRTKLWKIKCPDDSIIEIKNLAKFERDNNLKRNSLQTTIKTKKPHYSGFQVVGG